jgi:small-conductance mechanosensitive channel
VFKDSLKARKQRPGFQDLEKLGERRLEDLATEWKRYASGVTKWEESLLAKSEELEEQTHQMDELEAVWRVTRDTARAQRAPRATTRQIGSTLEEIGSTKAMLGKRFREILALQELVAAELRLLKEDADRIEAQREELRQRLFVRDAPPLWEAIAEETDSSRVVAAVSSTWIRNVSTTVDYFLANLDRVLLHIVLALVIFALLLLLRKQVIALGLTSEEETAPYSLRLLAYPWASALLVTIFLTFFLYPNRPVAVSDLALLLMLIPVLRLSLALVRGDGRILLATLALLYAMDLTQKLLSAEPAASRLVVLAEALFGLGLCVWLYRPKSLIRTNQVRGFRRTVRMVLPVALLLLAGSLVANIVGSVTLARRLASGVIDSSTIAVALAVVALLFDGVLTASARGWLGKVFRTIRTYEHVVTGRLSSLAHLAAFILWAIATFKAFGLYEPLKRWADAALFEKWGLGTVQISAIEILLFFGVLFGAFVLTRMVGVVLEEDVFGRIRLPRGVPGAVAMIVRYTLAGFGILLALAALGINLSEFGLLAGALGVGLGFGLQNVVANFVSGIILAFERPIQKGDMIQFGTLWGTVSGIGVRSTKVRSFDQSEVIIPNNDLITQQVTNWTLSDRRRRLDLPVKVAFGSDPRKVMEIMLKAAEEHPLTLKDQKPFAIFGGFGEHYIEFTLYFFIHTENFLVAKNEVGFNVLDALEQAGIQMPTPKRRLLMDNPPKTVRSKQRPKRN